MTSPELTEYLSDPASTAEAHPSTPPSAPGSLTPAAPTVPPIHAKGASPGRVALVAVALATGLICLLLVLVFVLFSVGPSAAAIGFALALIPLAIALAGVRWIDRWEPEPARVVIFALLWGAGVCALVASNANELLPRLLLPDASVEVLTTIRNVAVAPVTEEVLKGLGVLLLFWFARSHFDGPIDGIVYGGLIGAGFAFTENIIYFGPEVFGGGAPQTLGEVFFARGLLSPFLHVLFTAMTGLAVGLAARRGGAARLFGYTMAGLLAAIGLHTLWNASATFLGQGFPMFYVLVQLPIFVGAYFLVRYLGRQEEAVTRDRLADYAASGWFHPDEVDTLATSAGRREAIARARRDGTTALTRAYVRDATRLAFARQRIVTGRDQERARADEPGLLAAICATRAALTGSSL